MRQLRGWTLLEILVVMAIIAVLASIVYAIGAYALERSRQAQCISNLKQIGVALKLYMEDYKQADWDVEIDSVNIPLDANATSRSEQWCWRWGFPIEHMSLVNAGYLKDPRIFRCGSAKPPLARHSVHYLYQVPTILNLEELNDWFDSFNVFKQRKYDYPIFVDISHQMGSRSKYIVLRMNMTVETKILPLEKKRTWWSLHL